MHRLRRWRLSGAVLASLGLLVIATTAGPAGASTSVSTAPRRPAVDGSTCVRNTAADRRFVSLAYLAVLRRNGDASGVAFWASNFTYPTSMNYSEFVGHLTGSREARSRIVLDLYPKFFHRQADAAGLALWTSWLDGRTNVDLAGVLLSSPEYWSNSGKTYAGWVAHAYQDVVGHAPDAAGAAYWTEVLASGRHSFAGVAAAFYQNHERRISAVRAIYARVLRRQADASGLNYWATMLLRKSETWVLTQLVISNEFWRLAQVTYGAAPTNQPKPCPKPVPYWPATPQVVFTLANNPNRSSKLIALTFDDGPNPSWTPQILSVLASRHVTATFFTVGSWAQRYPNLIRQELAAGNHVANHTWNHPSLPGLSAGAQANEIASTTNLINGIAGRKVVHCVRPPYGNHNATTDAVAKGQGLSVIIWSRDSRDWQTPGVPAILAGSLDTTYDGGRGIVGLHDGGGDRSQTVAALGPLIDTLRARGYQFTTIC